jgi:hypothetical protein
LITIFSESSTTSAPASVVTQTVSIGVPEPSSTSTIKSNGKGGLSTGAKIGIGIGIAVVFLILLGLCIFKISVWMKRKAEEKGTQESPPAYTSEHPGHKVEILPNQDGVAPAPNFNGNYPEHISEMPGSEALRGHEMDAK